MYAAICVVSELSATSVQAGWVFSLSMQSRLLLTAGFPGSNSLTIAPASNRQSSGSYNNATQAAAIWTFFGESLT